ncbi:iron complex transport system substrate-binding protein [Tindallia magadiensis]|uniref:Iron complex transport system substrate-binding protein n=1 Tax=Tindallia magadiensis TaxID=69895 RepID=A0A1I3ASB9_9FIRM|nr:ABC transporter substrate-binding protein [Tindallia magadiensis]SFH52914.1 iron complex transport system substrate-binding protein [Tindallia magadiensis]
MKKFARYLLVVSLLVISLIVSACGDGDKEVMVNEASLNETMETDNDLQRIISLSPSQTENLFALGLDDSVIGVSDYCDYPQEVFEKEKLGSSWTINVERIIELKPDIVFVYGESHEEALELMRELNIKVVNVEPENVEEVFESIIKTGELTGKSNEAYEIVKALRVEKRKIVERVNELEPIPVFYQVWDEPLQTAGPESFIHELITLAGGYNIARNTEGAYPMYSVEALIEENPEIYFMPPHVADFDNMTEEIANSLREEVKNRPGYDQIKAIQNDRIELLEPNIVSRPGVRVIEGLEIFASAMHPEEF